MKEYTTNWFSVLRNPNPICTFDLKNFEMDLEDTLLLI